MLNDGKLIPTFSVHNRPLIPYYWTRVTVPHYSLLDHWLLSGINALTFFHIFLITIVDSLRVTNNHLRATRQLPPLFLCLLLPRRAKEYGKSFFGGLPCSCFEILIPLYLLWGDISVSWLPRFLFVLATRVSIPCVSYALNLLPFFSKKPPHILLLLRYTLSLGPETKRKLLHLLYDKTPFSSLNGWFCFH